MHVREEQDAARLAVTLGYTQFQQFADTGTNPAGMRLTEYLLPPELFLFTGPYVITRQLVLDRTGASAWQRDGRQRIRARMQRLPV